MYSDDEMDDMWRKEKYRRLQRDKFRHSLRGDAKAEYFEAELIQRDYKPITKGEIRFLRYAFDQLVKGLEDSL